jgi:hypothetical protein
MSGIDLIAIVFQALQSVPYVGPIIVFILGLVMPISVVLSAFCLAWQSLIAFLNALGAIPGLSFLQGVAAKLKADEAKVEGFINADIIPIIKALSAIPVPSTSSILPVAEKAPQK